MDKNGNQSRLGTISLLFNIISVIIFSVDLKLYSSVSHAVLSINSLELLYILSVWFALVGVVFGIGGLIDHSRFSILGILIGVLLIFIYVFVLLVINSIVS